MGPTHFTILVCMDIKLVSEEEGHDNGIALNAFLDKEFCIDLPHNRRFSLLLFWLISWMFWIFKI